MDRNGRVKATLFMLPVCLAIGLVLTFCGYAPAQTMAQQEAYIRQNLEDVPAHLLKQWQATFNNRRNDQIHISPRNPSTIPAKGMYSAIIQSLQDVTDKMDCDEQLKYVDRRKVDIRTYCQRLKP